MESLNIKNNDQDVSVRIEGDIVRYKITNIINEREVGHLINIGTQILNEKITSLVLIDISKMDKFSLGTRISWIHFFKNPQIKKTAILGGNRFIKTAVSFVIASVDTNNIRLFLNEEEALNWLRS